MNSTSTRSPLMLASGVTLTIYGRCTSEVLPSTRATTQGLFRWRGSEEGACVLSLSKLVALSQLHLLPFLV